MKFTLVIVETSVFTRRVQGLLTSEEYRLLQLQLFARPDIGSIIVGGGGLRKVRWHARGQGKRSGVRVIYYWAVHQDRLLILFAYVKNEQGELSQDQLKVLRQVVEGEYP